MVSTAATPQAERVSFRRLWWAGPLGGLAAVVVNLALYFIAAPLGFIPQTVLVQPANQPVTFVPVIAATLMPTIVATLLFALLVRFTRRPVTIFRIIAAVVLVLSFAQPFVMLPDAPLAMAITLNLMHVVAAAGITWGLTVLAREQ
ncbi:MAG: DUF6069 family protein [Chloroflexaceae bacterium]|jgi:hypothetical protein|nr:DUF6069 family protein [Chloroflexaceae bacterium]